MINEDTVGALIHGNRNNNVDITFTETISTLKITTTSDVSFYITLIVEEWGQLERRIQWNKQFYLQSAHWDFQSSAV